MIFCKGSLSAHKTFVLGRVHYDCDSWVHYVIACPKMTLMFYCYSYFYEDERGLFPECQFVFDLEVPESFTPVNADGEVESFSLMDVDQVLLYFDNEHQIYMLLL